MRMWRHRNITAQYHELPKTRQTRDNRGCTTGECKTYNTIFHAKKTVKEVMCHMNKYSWNSVEMEKKGLVTGTGRTTMG